ncbi:PREDICTED: uncharacterized protein At2g33490-like [Tarenaya hassleriana]|uniref:uncharacterized protein At2g33490-like n=1 Tax=Tarenaya hassleriana TaxID=28532 RepID=UPI00053C703A|nr:PREDICTED: uncharacterized protein At2g33490-like [Tarenaya hassleriana]
MMKASIGRLRRFAFHKVDGKDKGELFPTAQIDELARAVKDMQDIRECYDKLLSAAAATANSAYEFSESLGEMGSCLEKIALHNDEESGKILLMLGRVQFELRRLVDTYRAHIFKTITHPSESLLNELRTVEDMKRQCDEKRDVYEYMMSHVKEKGRPKCKGENSMSHQLQAAHNEFHDEATLCIFRLKSLKQGQSRSLLTQAARHHSSQMRLFRDGLQSLEAVEKHVRIAAEKQHIDCELSVHGNEMEDTNNDDDDDRYINRDGELSFDCRTSTQRIEALSTPRKSIKEDADLSFPRPSATEPAVMYRDKKEHQVSSHDNRASSHSAPLFLEKRCDFSDRMRQMNPSPAQAGTNAYVLPTPAFTTKPAPSNVKPPNHSGNTWQWHSSPLEQVKNGKDSENSSSISARLPRPSSGEPPQFSVPLMSKPFSGGAVSRLPVRSPKVSPVGSPPPPPLGSSPQVSELHELPRPPGTVRRAKSPGGLVGHSAPVSAWSGSHERSTGPSSTGIVVGAPLPVPPLVVVPRSFSIPSRDQRAVALMNHRSPPSSLPQFP